MSKIADLKKAIDKKNLLLLDKNELKSLYIVEKLLAWQESHSDIKWEEFKECWFQCSSCGNYSTDQCICYAR